jgi:hypothetical protein
MTKWSGINALACLLAGTLTSIAQTSNDHLRTLGASQGATAQAAVRPAQQSGPGHIYSVAGLPLGSRVQFDTADYREYKCSPSEQFAGYTWCQKTRQEKDRRGSINVTYSVLHSSNGTVFYVNRFQEPAFTTPNEADAAIRQYSSKLGEKAEIKKLPRQQGRPEGTLATWGKVTLEPLDRDSLNTVAAGKSPKIGFLVDFIGDFARSAKENLPIYRVSGGPGFVWVASFDQRGRGTLRLTAIDPSPLTSTPLPNETPTSADQTTRANPEVATSPQAAAQNPKPDTEVVLPQPEKAEELPQPDTRITPPETASGTQVAENPTEKLSAESLRLNDAVRQLETEKAAAESKARRMESVAYGTGVLALLAIVSSILFVPRKRAVTIEPQVSASKKKPADFTKQFPAHEPPPSSDAPPTKPDEPNSASLGILSRSDSDTAETIETSSSEARRLPIQMMQKSE